MNELSFLVGRNSDQYVYKSIGFSKVLIIQRVEFLKLFEERGFD
jgi:hypothetical protein